MLSVLDPMKEHRATSVIERMRVFDREGKV